MHIQVDGKLIATFFFVNKKCIDLIMIFDYFLLIWEQYQAKTTYIVGGKGIKDGCIKRLAYF